MEKRDSKTLFVEDDYSTGMWIYYEDKDRQKLFNGIIYDLYPDGVLEWEAEVVNGKIHGIEKDFYLSGELEQIN